MVKTAYDTVLDMMLNAPCSIHNATVAYHQLFLVLGNGFAWNTDGRLVQELDDTEQETNDDLVLYSQVRDNELFLKRLEKSVAEQVKAHLLNRTFTLGDDLESAHNGNEADYLLSEEVADKLNEHLHNVFTVKEHMRDFTLPCDGYRFHPICEHSNLNNIPVNVTCDWLYAVQTFIEILDKHPYSVRDPKCLLPGIKEHVKSILKSKADDSYKQVADDFYGYGKTRGIMETEQFRTWPAYKPILTLENMLITEFYEVSYREHFTDKHVREWYLTKEEADIRAQSISHLEPTVTFCSVKRFKDW